MIRAAGGVHPEGRGREEQEETPSEEGDLAEEEADVEDGDWLPPRLPEEAALVVEQLALGQRRRVLKWRAYLFLR